MLRRLSHAAMLVVAMASALPGRALECPAMPQQSQRDWDVAVAVAVGRLGDAGATQLQTQTRTVTTDLLKRLPNADRVYLEQMMYATYCSSLRDNTALTEVERNARVQAYNRELRATLYGNGRPAVVSDPRDAARVELARLPVDYSPGEFLASAASGRMAVVRLFLQAGIDANASDRDGTTALMHAAGANDLPMIEALLRARANVNARSAGGGSALSWASAGGHVLAMRLLLKSGADKTSIDAAMPNAISSGDVDAVRLLLERGANVRVDEAETMRSLSRMRKSDPQRVARMFELLRQQGAAIDATDRDGWTGLMWAANDGNAVLAGLLVRAGADVNRHCECRGFGGGGHTPLAMATWKDSEETVALLLDSGARVDEPSNDGTPLMMAAEHRSARMVKLLLARGADPNKAHKPDGETALMHATRHGGDMVAPLLAAGANVDDHSTTGLTALTWAAYLNQPKAAELLLDAGANIEHRDGRGLTPLMVAAIEGSVETARLLLARGARRDAVDDERRTALAHAASRTEGESRTRMLKLLMQKDPE